MLHVFLRAAALPAMLLLSAAATGSARAAAPPADPDGIARYAGRVDAPDVVGGYISDHVIVRLASGVEPFQRGEAVLIALGGAAAFDRHGPGAAASLSDAGVVSVRAAIDPPPKDAALAAALGLDRYYLLKIAPGTDAREVVRTLRRQPLVETAELDGIGGLLDVPTDPSFPEQWSLRNTGQPVDGQPGQRQADVNALDAWAFMCDPVPVTIAILDTGVSHSHPDLAGKLVEGWSFVTCDPTDTDDSSLFSHGTHVAGIAAAATNNQVGIAGMAWQASIMPVRVSNPWGFSTETLCASGIVWAASTQADVLSISIGFGQGSTFLQIAVQYAALLNKVVVASTGNTPGVPIAFPAAYPEVIAVGATDNLDAHATFSTTGPQIDVCAPGVGILSTWDTTGAENGYRVSDGTSMACPHVSGLAALIRSVRPGLTAIEVREYIESTAEDLGPVGWDAEFGHGRINAGRAVGAALGISLCPADWTHDGAVDTADFFSFFGDYFGPGADFNRDGVTNSADLIEFIDAFFQGCDA